MATSPSLRNRLAGHSQALLGGVAVLAVAGALSAGLGSANLTAGAATPATQAAGFASLLTTGRLRRADRRTRGCRGQARRQGNDCQGPSPLGRRQPARTARCPQSSPTRTPSMSGRWPRTWRGSAPAKPAVTTARPAATATTVPYQFDLSTWHGLGLSGYPSNASHQLQDVAVVRLEARRGWSPWPVCSYAAGLR